MESVGAWCSPTGVIPNLLSLPAPCSRDEDEESLGLVGIKPKSSPIPRRRSSSSSDDSLTPASSSRRVSFADAFGLSLVSVKQFDAWGVTASSVPLESELNEEKEYYMVPLFTFPLTADNLAERVYKQKLELESLELIPGTTSIRGIVRVLNVCFDKMVYVRTSLDSWRSHFDLLAEYVPGSNNGEMDCFSFKLLLVPPFGEEGTQVNFCLRYETSVGSFWANNGGENYSLCCCERMKEKPQSGSENPLKSCLKTTGSSFPDSSTTTDIVISPDDSIHFRNSSVPQSQHEASERLEKEAKELVEEISRNRSRRSRRKAARLEKVKEHFAKRDEIKLAAKTEKRDVMGETSMQDRAPEMESTWSPPSKQIDQPSSDSHTLPTQSLQSCENLRDHNEIHSQVLTQEDKDAIINFKTTLITEPTNVNQENSVSCQNSIGSSAFEVLAGLQKNEEQSIIQPFLKSQHSGMSTYVEKAWEHFEKDAKLRMKCMPPSSEMEKEADICNEETMKHSGSQHHPPSFKFGTIKAPLYHQVFENIEAEKKEGMPKKSQEHVLFKEQEDESQSAAKPPENTDIWYESRISTKQISPDVCDSPIKESTLQNSQEIVSETKKPLSEQNKCKGAMLDYNLNQSYTDGYSKDNIPNTVNLAEVTSNQLNAPLELPPVCRVLNKFQDGSCHSLCLFPTDDSKPLVTSNEKLQEKIPLLSPNTSIAKSSLFVDNQTNHFDIETPGHQDATNSQIKEKNKMAPTEPSVSKSSINELGGHLTFGISLGFFEDNIVANIEKHDEISNTTTQTFLLTEQHKKQDITERILINEKEEDTINESIQAAEKCNSSQNYFTGAQHIFCINDMDKIFQRSGNLFEGKKELEYPVKTKVNLEKDQKSNEDIPEEKFEYNGGIHSSIECDWKYIDDEDNLEGGEREEKKYPLFLERDEADVFTRTLDPNCNSEFIETVGSEVWEIKNRYTFDETGKSWQKHDVEVFGRTQGSEIEYDLSEFTSKEENLVCKNKIPNIKESQNKYFRNTEHLVCEEFVKTIEYILLTDGSQVLENHQDLCACIDEEEHKVGEMVTINRLENNGFQSKDANSMQSYFKKDDKKISEEASCHESFVSGSTQELKYEWKSNVFTAQYENVSDKKENFEESYNKLIKEKNQDKDHGDCKEEIGKGSYGKRGTELSGKAQDLKTVLYAHETINQEENMFYESETEDVSVVVQNKDNQQIDSMTNICRSTDCKGMINERASTFCQESSQKRVSEPSGSSQELNIHTSFDIKETTFCKSLNGDDVSNLLENSEHRIKDSTMKESNSFGDFKENTYKMMKDKMEKDSLTNNFEEDEDNSEIINKEIATIWQESSENWSTEHALDNCLDIHEPIENKENVFIKSEAVENVRISIEKAEIKPKDSMTKVFEDDKEHIAEITWQESPENKMYNIVNKEGRQENGSVERDSYRTGNYIKKVNEGIPTTWQDASLKSGIDLRQSAQVLENCLDSPETIDQEENVFCKNKEHMRNMMEDLQKDSMTEALEDYDDFKDHIEVAFASWQKSSIKSDTEVSGSLEDLESISEIHDTINQEEDVFCESETVEDVSVVVEIKDSQNINSMSTLCESTDCREQSNERTSTFCQEFSQKRGSEPIGSSQELNIHPSFDIEENAFCEILTLADVNIMLETTKQDANDSTKEVFDDYRDHKEQVSEITQTLKTACKMMKEEDGLEKHSLTKNFKDAFIEKIDEGNPTSWPECSKKKHTELSESVQALENYLTSPVTIDQEKSGFCKNIQKMSNMMENEESIRKDSKTTVFKDSKYFKYHIDEEAFASLQEYSQMIVSTQVLDIHEEIEMHETVSSDSVSIENVGNMLETKEKDGKVSKTQAVHYFEENHSEGTCTSCRASSQKVQTDNSVDTEALEIDCDANFDVKEENSVFEELPNILKTEECLGDDLENSEENTSTESQIDDEMELYLNSLRNSQQSLFREAASGGFAKRPSISRRRPSMPSISESVDEDKPNSSQEDLTNMEYMLELELELERATLPLVQKQVIGRNVLWWKEFLSCRNMTRIIGYSFLLIVFLVVAYYYDFMACFGLYLLTVYWLFRQGEGEPLKNSRKGEGGLQ